MRVVVKLAVVCALLVNLAGCGYALTGRGSALPSNIVTIGIPTFTNATSVYDVEQKFTEKVRLEMISRGKYKVTPDSSDAVDAVLIGQVTGVTIQPTAFNSEQLASRYAFNVTASVTLTDTHTKKVLYENPALTFREEYEVSTSAAADDANAFLGQNQTALDRLTTNFARTVVASILEAF